MNKIEGWQLKQWQNLSLDGKIALSKQRIRDWYEYWRGQVSVSFSGGKDSTVLLHLVRLIYPSVKGIFSNTGLEYPEIVEFVKTVPDIVVVRPEKSFYEVITNYGYPVVSKMVAKKVRMLQNPTEKNYNSRHLYETGVNSKGESGSRYKLPKKWLKLVNAPFKVSEQCCDIIKKKPLIRIQKEMNVYPFIGNMATDGEQREKQYLKHGCNIYEGEHPQSQPIAFWTEKDIWDYIHRFNIPYCSIYDTGVRRTGCMFCMFGVHMEEKPNRFQLMAVTHPKLYDYCINKLGIGKVMDYINVDYKPIASLNRFCGGELS